MEGYLKNMVATQWWISPTDGSSNAAPITTADIPAINLVCTQNQIALSNLGENYERNSKGPVTYLDPQTEPVLYIYFAPKAHRALVLRIYQHTIEMILWHTDTDIFERGQWTLSGKLKTTVSTISDDGKYFHYKLCKNKGMLLINAISEIPFFTAKEVHNDSYAEDITKGMVPTDYEGHNRLSMTSGQSVILTLANHQGQIKKCKIIADRGRIFKLNEGDTTYVLILDTTNDTFTNMPAPYTTKIKPNIIKK